MSSPAERARSHRVALLVAWLAAGLGIALLAYAFISFRQGSYVDGQWVYVSDDFWGYDFEAYIDAAVRLATGGSLYQPETLGGPFRPGPHGLYMYSPPVGASLLPLTGMAVADSSIVWFGLHVAWLILACAVMPVRPVLRIFAFAVAALSLAVVKDALLGNVSVLLLLPMAVAWRWLDRPAGSAATAVAISIRPMLAILLVRQLLRRQWRAVAWTIGAGLVLILVTLPFVGVGAYSDYLTVLRHISGVTGVEHNVDLGSTALLLGLGEDAGPVALLAGYVVAGLAILLSLRRDREVGFMVALGASLLLSPLLWDHYLAILVLPAAFLAQRGRPVAILLPLLSWLPQETLAAVAVLATVLPFWARDTRDAMEPSMDAAPKLSYDSGDPATA